MRSLAAFQGSDLLAAALFLKGRSGRAPISISPDFWHIIAVRLVVRHGLELQNLDALRRVIDGLPRLDSVFLNRAGDSFSLIGFRQSSGRRKPISVEIPRLWLENACMLESVEGAALRFASLMAEDAGDVRKWSALPADHSGAHSDFARLRL